MSVIGKNNLESVDFDTAIGLTGHGKFHHEILAVCALCLLSTGFQNGLSAYVFPAAQKTLQLTSTEIGFLNVSFLIGATSSAFLWGVLADLNGRKKVLIYTLFLDFCNTVISSFMNSYHGLALCRLLNGFLIGAPGSVTFTYLAEFYEPKLRMKIVCYSGIFFTLSWLILPILSFIILPMEINIKITDNLNFTSWRLFLLIISLPEIIACLWLMKLPESPKFLECKGRLKKAQFILKNIYTINTGNNSNDYPVKSLKQEVRFQTSDMDNVKVRNKSVRIIQNILMQIKSLFQPPLLGLTVLMSIITFANMFGYFGLVLWIPDLFSRFEEYSSDNPNATLTLTSLNLIDNNNNYTNVGSDEYTPEFNFNIFKNTLIIGVCSIIGSILSGWIVGKVSIKVTPLVTMLLGGLSSGCIYFVQSINQFFLLSCIFQATMATANMVLGSIAIELFPTNVSAMAFCLTICIGRIGAIISNIIFGVFMDEHCEIPILLVCLISIIGSLFCLLIPSTKNFNCKNSNLMKNSKYQNDI